MQIINIIKTLNATLNLTTIINVFDKDILNEIIFSYGYLEDNFNRDISDNENPFKTSDIATMNRWEKVNRQKRFTENDYSETLNDTSDSMDISKRCLCPWKTAWHFDRRRTPAFLPKAVCGNKCNFNFTNTTLSYLLDMLTTCEPFTRGIVYDFIIYTFTCTACFFLSQFFFT